MEIQAIEKEKMESLKALATANVAIGEAKGILAKLKTEESEYLESREKKALERVKKIIDESDKVLNEALANYGEIHQFAKDTAELANFLSEACADFTKLRETFQEYTKNWEISIKEQEKALEKVKNQIKSDQLKIKSDQSVIEQARKQIAEDRKVLIDERETLDRAIIRLKDNKI